MTIRDVTTLDILTQLMSSFRDQAVDAIYDGEVSLEEMLTLLRQCRGELVSRFKRVVEE